MSYDALAMDGELKDALQDVMGASTLETEKLQGFTLKTHFGTGIQYLWALTGCPIMTIQIRQPL